MALIDARTTRVLFTALLFALALGFLYVARQTLVAFLFAILFAYLIEPAVAHVERLAHGRGRAIALIYILLIALLGGLFFSIGPRVGRQAQRLGDALPEVLENVGSGDIAIKLGNEHGWSESTQQHLQTFLKRHQRDLLRLAQRLGFRAAELAQEAWLFIVVPILAAFFLRDGKAFGEVLTSLVHTRAQREFLQGVLEDLNHMLAHFIRAQLTLAAFSFVAYIAFLGPMKMPYALVLSTAGGMMEFIPVVGPLLAGALILVVALLMSYPHWLLLLLFLGAWRLVQDYVISPRIMGRSLELHPLAAIFGVLAGGEIAGVLGVYLSIPVMASLRIVWRRSRLYSEKRRFGPLNEFPFPADVITRE
jgi:predicted PurR-regulated permease PerM